MQKYNNPVKTCSVQVSETDIAWYAMSATYRSELKIHSDLQSRGVECYLPLQTVEKEHRGKKIKVRVPLVSNLIFLHSSRQAIRQLKLSIPHLQYKILRETGCLPRPITVPDRDMLNFIKATGGFDGVQVSVLRDGTLSAAAIPAGIRVRVTGGPMDGLEGTLVKTTGRKNHSLVVTLDKLCSIQLVIPRSLVELLPAL